MLNRIRPYVLPIVAAAAFVAGSRTIPAARAIASPDVSSIPPDGPVLHLPPDPTALLQARVAKLEAEVAKLEHHTHTTTLGLQQVNGYMSIGQLRDAMVPHSPTDINVYWFPYTVSTGPVNLDTARPYGSSTPVYPAAP